MKNSLLSILLLALSGLFLTGCGGDDGAAGPTAPTSLAGGSISFNPTIEFVDGTNFNYTNDDGVNGFALGPISGTYTYTRDSNTQGTIVLTGTDIGGAGNDTLTIVLSNFTATGGNIATFRVTVDGQTFDDGQVVSGTIAAGPPASGNTGGINSPDATPATIAPGMVGTYNLTFVPAFGRDSLPSDPFTDGQAVSFEITAGGNLIIDGTTTLSSPVFLYGNEFEAIWYDGEFGYAASEALDGGLNEINIARGFDYQDRENFEFLGQFPFAPKD